MFVNFLVLVEDLNAYIIICLISRAPLQETLSKLLRAQANTDFSSAGHRGSLLSVAVRVKASADSEWHGSVSCFILLVKLSSGMSSGCCIWPHLQCSGVMPGFTGDWHLGPLSGLCIQL